MKPATSRRPSRSSAEPARRNDLDGREVVVGVCGGIAAYKTAAVVSALVQRGCGVTVVMTEAARHFITPLTFEALSGRRVHISLWEPSDDHDPQHLRLTERADLVLVAPATANIIAKMALGLADDLLSTMLLAAHGPVLLAPAMNNRMWENPAVQRNIKLLRDAKCHFVGPDSGWMACRTIGIGRMSDPDEIVSRSAELISGRRK